MTAAIWGASSSAWAQQVTLLSDDFQAGAINTTNFPTTSRAVLQSGTGFASQSLFFTGNPSQSRFAISKSMDFSGGNATLTFDLRYLNTGAADVGAFDAVEAGEDIVVEYSTNGVTYTNIQTFSAADNTYAGGFVTLNITLPAGSFSSTTTIQWRQVNFNANNDDTWAIDNVVIKANLVVPEPGTWALYALGATGLLAAVRRRRAAAKSAATTTQA